MASPIRKEVQIGECRLLLGDCLEILPTGTTGIACLKLGRGFIGIEQSEEHFETAVERISDAHSRPDLFISQRPPEPIQQPLFGKSAA